MSESQATWSSAAVCAEVIAAIDRIYASEGPDEPDLGLNICYVTTRCTLQRLVAAQAWELPVSVADAIHARLRRVEGIEDPERLETELLWLPSWTLRLVDRRRAMRFVTPGPVPQRRAGDDPGHLAG